MIVLTARLYELLACLIHSVNVQPIRIPYDNKRARKGNNGWSDSKLRHGCPCAQSGVHRKTTSDSTANLYMTGNGRNLSLRLTAEPLTHVIRWLGRILRKQRTATAIQSTRRYAGKIETKCHRVSLNHFKDPTTTSRIHKQKSSVALVVSDQISNLFSFNISTLILNVARKNGTYSKPVKATTCPRGPPQLGPKGVISSQMILDTETTCSRGPHLEGPLSGRLRQVSLCI